MAGPVPELADRAEACAKALAAADEVLLASHIDADGLTSAAVASSALARAGIAHEVVFEKQLDEAAIEGMAATDYETVLFTDFGSGQLDAIHAHADAFTPVIADHHQPVAADAVPDAPSTDGYADAEYHVNPLLVGLDGASELSGAGAAYCLARALEDVGDGAPAIASDGGSIAKDDEQPAPGEDEGAAIDNRDLAVLAVVGAVGDMQLDEGELVGANEAIVAEGEAVGVLETGTDLAMYGKQTRQLPKLLAYASDVYVPGITNDRDGAVRFLEGIDADLREGGEFKRWVDLDPEERQAVASALVQRAVSRGVPSSKIDRLIGTTYTLAVETPGTVLRDASEYSTLLNATARYERGDVGLAVCLGDRDGALDRAQTLLTEHRRNLSRGVEWVSDRGVTVEDQCQWFDAESEIRETIVGIVAGMALGTDGVDRNRPIVAFADADEEGDRKVSARATQTLVRRGVDLSEAMSTAAAAVDGSGGGHTIAAGATIPAGSEAAFVERVDEVLAEQLG